MNLSFGQHSATLDAFRQVLWYIYLLAAVMLPLCHVRPILRYLRGTRGIGDACIRSEALQCLWRVPALMFAVFVAPSLPLFLSVFLDLLGRIGRVLSMVVSHRRWEAATQRTVALHAGPPGRVLPMVRGPARGLARFLRTNPH